MGEAAIIPDLSTVEPRDALEAILILYPAKIDEVDRALTDLRRVEAKLKERIEEIEGKVAGLVALEKTPEGKQKYPNEAARLGRVQESLRANDEHHHLRKEVWEGGARIGEVSRYKARLEDELKSARLIVLSRAKFRLEVVL